MRTLRDRLLALALPLALLPMTPAAAQRIGGGVAYAFADYAEQGPSLRFAGGGAAGHMSLEWRRLTVQVGAASLSFEPDAGTAEAFEMLQTDARLRLRLSRVASLEAGWLKREVEPLHAAQSVAALRLGGVVAFPIAAGSDVSLRSSWLGASRFSGGGSAPFGVEVGLGTTYAPWSERFRVMADLEFQRFDRRTSTAGGRLEAPIQSTTARIGVSVVR